MNFIDNFAEETNRLPEKIKPVTTFFLQRLEEKLTPEQQEILSSSKFTSLIKVSSCSLFIQDLCLRHPDWLIDAVESGNLFSDCRREDYYDCLNAHEFDSDETLFRRLRIFRQQEMLRIAWRDLAGWAELDETLKDLTALAEACIQTALTYFYQTACRRFGTPEWKDGAPMNLIVLGMGKLGAWELNFSSDIDLIFAYPRDGTLNDRKQTTYGEFFSRICRSLLKALDEITADGFVFRSDIRLRPFGSSGPIVMNFDGMEHYYMTQAREWERYAMIKARQVAGDEAAGARLMDLIKPFVYRRYLDYGAFDELRTLKFQITQELKRKDRLENIKLGPGGIREVEFIGQAFQLIRGGCEPELQQRSILQTLSTLKQLRLLQHHDCDVLYSGYQFLRRVENHLQQYKDEQTHDLPEDDLARAVLAYSMGYADWDSFKIQLDQVRDAIHAVFDQVFSSAESEQKVRSSHLIWLESLSEEDALNLLAEYGYQNCKMILDHIVSFKYSNAVKKMTAKGARVLDRLLPKTIEIVSQVDNKDQTFISVLMLFEEVAGRNVYLSLLAENPEALKQLVSLSAASTWICKYLAHFPILLDELLDAHRLFEPLRHQQLRQQLMAELERLNPHDEEQLMNRLRQFKQQNVLRVAAADIMGLIPVRVVSDYLTCIAEVTLEEVIAQAWNFLLRKYGDPTASSERPSGFAIIGLGKLGGRELGYGSDLDMVFVYDCPDPLVQTPGPKKISVTQFYLRLGQKIRHILDTNMLSGVLYQVDLRLRPSGDSGLLVTQIDSYLHYLHNDAWTWEHQALVRGRFIAGDDSLKNRFSDIRRQTLALSRELTELKQKVADMRIKMRENFEPKDAQLFHLKHSKGGIADIEFIVQFFVLAYAYQKESLLANTDNLRLLECLAGEKLITESEAERLKNAYFAFRDSSHRLVLQDKPLLVSSDEFESERADVEEVWKKYLA